MPRVQNALSLGYLMKKTLFELLPDLFPPFLTAAEISLWERYYEQKPDKAHA